MKGGKALTITAIYPGTFDPITNGHANLVHRASNIFDIVIVAIAINPRISPILSLQKRVNLAEQTLIDWTNVTVCDFDGLLVKTARKKNANVIIRGIRTISDFEYEFGLASMNRKMEPDIETLFFTSAEQFHYISSSLVREIAALDEDVSELVSPCVAKALKNKLVKNNNNG